MHFFEEPELQIVRFSIEDIIATSDSGDVIKPVGGENMGDWA